MKTVIFDNDGTLYKITPEFKGEIIRRMFDFLIENITIPTREIPATRKMLIEKYRIECTEYVFAKEYGINIDDFINKVYNVDCSKLGLYEDPSLRKTLSSINAKKIIYTNNNSKLAKNILETLGVLDLFEEVIGIDTLDYFSKPYKKSFRKMLDLTNITNSDVPSTYFVEDTLENLLVAKELGIKTVLISKQASEKIDYTIDSIHNLREIEELK